jgi:hypothetical protein
MSSTASWIELIPRMRWIFIVLIFIGANLKIFSQKDSIIPAFIPSPKKSAVIGLAIPAGGQVYNRKYWKAPIALGAYVGMVYVIDFNQDIYRRLSVAYQSSLKNESHEFSNLPGFNTRTLRSLRDAYDKRTQMSYVGAIFVHFLVALEAFVDAHLQDFDITEDLSINYKPQIIIPPTGSNPYFGLTMTIPLN